MIPASFDYEVAESAEHAISLLGGRGDECDGNEQTSPETHRSSIRARSRAVANHFAGRTASITLYGVPVCAWKNPDNCQPERNLLFEPKGKS